MRRGHDRGIFKPFGPRLIHASAPLFCRCAPKKIGKEALGPCGVTKVQHEITSETLAADIHYEPDPAREAERARLGLLGRMAVRFRLIERYDSSLFVRLTGDGGMVYCVYEGRPDE